MWFFSSPTIVFGESALSYLERLEGQRAFLVTDANLVRLGYAQKICAALPPEMSVETFDAVEPDPSLATVRRGAERMLAFQPQWIIALGGGSVMDAAKAMWVLYERPGYDPAAINPAETLHLRVKARLAAIPTTTGTGAEATWAIVLTDGQRKLGLGNRENVPDVAILDPELVAALPARITADTGMDALTHAIEGYTSNMHNDFCDGLCLQAARLVFDYLPTCVKDGSDMNARERVQNAAAIAGLGFGNSMDALAHGMGHSLGGVFHLPHGRAVSLCLPYTIEYSARGEYMPTRYADIARHLGLPASDEAEGAASLAQAVRSLAQSLGQPLTLAGCGISRPDFEGALDVLVENALNDSQTSMAPRFPDNEEMRRLFWAAYDGQNVDF